MTGPALLLGLVLSAVQGYVTANPGQETLSLVINLVGWLFGVLAVYLTGRLLTRKGASVQTLRVLGFAQSARIVLLISFIPALAPLVLLLIIILTPLMLLLMIGGVALSLESIFGLLR